MDNAQQEINSSTITLKAVQTAVQAAASIDSRDTEDVLIMMNQFLLVLDDAGLIQIDDDMEDLEKIERGMYAASLFMSACANIGKAATKRADDIEGLEAMLSAS